MTRWTTAAAVFLAGCSGSVMQSSHAPPTVTGQIATQVASVGSAFSLDATAAGAQFTDPDGGSLNYTVSFASASGGLSAVADRITGVPAQPGVVTATIAAHNSSGDSASVTFKIVVFAAGLSAPQLPTTPLAYSGGSAPLPLHFLFGTTGSVVPSDNTPVDNPITDRGATLGRVLFYDPRLSVNDQVACASCHQQRFGFSDTARFSHGVGGGLTTRHAMGLANGRFYAGGRFFWDERAPSLEAQVLQPIQNSSEMALSLDDLVVKLGATSYYPALFNSVFGTPDVTSDRVSRALAQFVRSLVSATSRFDSVFIGGGPPDFTRLTAQEQQGHDIFVAPGSCSACHRTNAVMTDAARNTGLDATITDVGAGGGRFKAPSLKNVALHPPYMHDGRFRTLQQVVDFYDHGIQSNPGLDTRLQADDGTPLRLKLSQVQRDALVAYLNTLTDQPFLAAARFSDPFPGH